MVSEVECFVNWLGRRNPDAHTWLDCRSDLEQFVIVVGDPFPRSITFHDMDRFMTSQAVCGLKLATINRRLVAIMSLDVSVRIVRNKMPRKWRACLSPAGGV